MSIKTRSGCRARHFCNRLFPVARFPTHDPIFALQQINDPAAHQVMIVNNEDSRLPPSRSAESIGELYAGTTTANTVLSVFLYCGYSWPAKQ